MKIEEQKKILGNIPGEAHFGEKLEAPLKATGVDIFQINVGKRCNLSCKHCHVEAGPDRPEVMSKATMEKCLEIIKFHPIGTIDITGGSPEMNPYLPWFLDRVSALGRRVMIRTNLVILSNEGYRHFIDLYVNHRLEIVTSLPALDESRVDRQRGQKAFARIIDMIQQLNQKGYGHPDSGLILNLVHNPIGAYLPGSQQALENEYRNRLFKDYGIYFNALYTLTNCPVGRYLEFLVRSDNYKDYMHDLIAAFNRSAVENVMCRRTVSVGWDGMLYDCDFNQMLSLPINHGAPDHVSDFDMEQLKNRRIVIGNHCYSCTAGAGSSCQGVLE
jgi:radical SAM/Cys-rich protein